MNEVPETTTWRATRRARRTRTGVEKRDGRRGAVDEAREGPGETEKN